MTAYYNEFDAYPATWLKNLVEAGHIAQGRVDSRSIVEVSHVDVGDATQAHFFAGIGVWSYALRLAGWPDDWPVWTGSCPCQPFSVAGRQRGTEDERHLWPEWLRLIGECRPPVIFGEQVASADGRAWLATVRTDLEALGYAVGAADMCAAGVGAPHIRQRLFFGAHRLADADATGRGQLGLSGVLNGLGPSRRNDVDGRGASGARGLGNAGGARARRDAGAGIEEKGGTGVRPVGDASESSSSALGLGEPNHEGLEGQPWHVDALDEPGRLRTSPHGPAPTSGFWSNPDWVACRDGKQRPIEPGAFPLAHGAPARVGRLRAYGNAIVAQVAATFVKAFVEAT